MKKVFLSSLLFFVGVFTPVYVQGAPITCTDQSTGSRAEYVCGVVDEMEKPGNCDLEGAAQIKCIGEPNGYKCAGNGSSLSCDIAAMECASVTNGYDCVLPISGQLPNGCTSFGGGMRCSSVPTNYTVNNSGVSPTSVTPSYLQTPSNQASSQNGNLSYVPLEPLPGLKDAQTGTGDFAALLQGFFTILLSIGAFLAVTTLVMGGISYMFSEKLLSKTVARDRIKAAFWGLGILGGAWLLLNTINPQLVTFDKDLLSPTDSTTGSQNASTAAPFRSYSASSESGQQYASQHGALRDNPSGAVMFVNRDSRSDKDVIEAYRKMHSDCEAADGTLHMANTVDRQTYVYLCSAQ